MGRMTVAELVAQLDEQEVLDLAEAFVMAIQTVKLASQSVAAPEAPAAPRDVTQLLDYLTQAIDQLETARALVKRRAVS